MTGCFTLGSSNPASSVFKKSCFPLLDLWCLSPLEQSAPWIVQSLPPDKPLPVQDKIGQGTFG